MIKISELARMDVFTEGGRRVGRVFDIILDLQRGEIARLSTAPIDSMTHEDAERVFREHTILYRSVKAVDKIIIVSHAPLPEEAPAPAPEQPRHGHAIPVSGKGDNKHYYSYRYRHQG